MKRFSVLVISLLFLIFSVLSGCRTGAEQLNECSFVMNIQYANAGGRMLMLNLTTPDKGKGPFPVVVLVHGWTGNSYDLLDVQERLGEVEVRHDALAHAARLDHARPADQQRGAQRFLVNPPLVER